MSKATEYLKPGAIVPVDIETTALLVNALRQALANEALDKMAENARELGIQMQPAQPAVPDAIHHTDLSESLEYIQGWNDCRAEMLKARSNT